MAAVMLAGSPFAATEAFAAPATTENSVNVSASSVTFKNGTKFVIEVTAGNYYQTKEVTNTATGVTYATYKSGTTTSLAAAAVFEATKVSTNALGITFELKVNGRPFALVAGATNVKAATAADKILTTFTSVAPASGSTYKLDGMTLVLVEPAGASTGVATTAGQLKSKKLDYKSVNLNEFNASSTTFSFPGEDLVGNVFESVIPFTFGSGDLGATSASGTYFVKGAAADIKALKNATNATDRTAALKKLSVVSVLNEKYGLNSKVAGEGYKLALISGAEFYKTSGAKFDNAAFISIMENDQLNNEGELVLTISPYVGTPVAQSTVIIAAVKASASDTKTYVTTVATTGSLFDTKSNPSLGSNTFFDASDFLNAGEVSAYNVFFTSGNPVSAGQQPMEYGRYLSVVSDAGVYKLHATSPDSTIVNAPLSQWIVTDFDGKYTLSLKSREGNQPMSLRLVATDNADEYKIANDGSVGLTIDNIKPLADDGVTTINTLVGRTIKLIPTTLTKNDGYVVLSKEDMSGTIAVSFSGKDAIKGSQTYYMTPDATTPTKFVPTLKASDAAELNFALNEAVPADDYITTAYAYLDKDGRVMTDGVDTLVVPSYTVTYKVGTTPYYVTGNDFSVTPSTTGAPGTTQKVVLKKHLSGSYALGIYGKAKQAAPVNAAAVRPNGAAFVSASKKLNALQDGDFAYVSLSLEDQNDYTTLEAVSRHATFESAYGSVAMQENKNGILEGILSAAPLTFWLDTADSEKATPAFYISVGIKGEEEAPATKADAAPVMRNFLYNPADSSVIYNPGSATSSKVEKYFLEGTNKANLKAIFRPAALVAEDTLVSVVDGKEVAVVTEKADATKGQVNGLKNFQYRISLADPDVEGEYVVKSKANNQYLYSLNGRLGFTADKKEAWIFTLGEGDATANEAIAAEAGIQVIGGQGVVTVQGAAGKVVTVANILGQTLANQVAASDNVTIAVPAGIVVVAVDGEATKVVVK